MFLKFVKLFCESLLSIYVAVCVVEKHGTVHGLLTPILAKIKF